MKKIAIITARSGSKGLPNKNVLMVDGKPLIAYSIEAAIDSQEFDKIIVSTDSQEYIDLLSHYPIDFIKRAPHLATDTASSFMVIEDVLQQYKDTEFDYFVLLQPTSPLRTAQHIREANEKFEKNFDQFDFLVSVSNAHKPTTLTREIDDDESLKNFQLDYSNYARQNYFPEYSPNGAIFSAKPAQYLVQKHFYGEKCLAYFMDKEVSVDIDDRQDFEHFYFIIQQRNKEKLLLENIKREIHYKSDWFNQSADIALLGHSLFAQWNVSTLAEQQVSNLAISAITTQQYLDLIIHAGKITRLPQKVLLFFGINDLRKPFADVDKTINAVQQIIQAVRKINPNSKIYFLQCLNTVFRVDCNNNMITEFNQKMQTCLQQNNVNYIELNSEFNDSYGKLNPKYSNDGLHLNADGYILLEDILNRELA